MLRIRRFLLDLDAWLDSKVFGSRACLREQYERFSTYMDRFYVCGSRRLLVELLSDMGTLGTAGLVLMLVLAAPAFQKTSDHNWLKPTDLSVTFQDRQGNEIGHRGIRHSSSLPLDEYPSYLIQAVLATEDRRFYEHSGIDISGIARALIADLSAGGVVQGGSSITQQLAKNLFLAMSAQSAAR